jgi:hypothetical protein
MNRNVASLSNQREFSTEVRACKTFQHRQVPYCSLLAWLALPQTLTLVAVLMEGEEMQIHRHATAGPLSVCLVVVVKMNDCNIFLLSSSG